MTRRPNPKGWCPSSLRPMESGDGYIVRIKPSFGRVSRKQLGDIARLAENFGNGIIELTNRANMQLRGVAIADHPELIDALRGADLVDLDPIQDSAPQILVSPKCEDNLRALYDVFRQAKLPKLPAKFGLVLEHGTQYLSNASGDIRICETDGQFCVWADGSHGCLTLDAKSVIAHVQELSHWFVKHSNAELRRMAQVINVTKLPEEWGIEPLPKVDNTCDDIIYTVPFGQMRADHLMQFAKTIGTDDIRLTPRRSFVVVGETKLRDVQGFITDPNAPILRAQACVGAPRCQQAHGETHQLARRLTELSERDIHVSGCNKGCAKQVNSPLTVVHGANGLDLIMNGCTWDQPDFSGLDEFQLVQKIREIDATHL